MMPLLLDVRELSSLAAFKGYNVLKKISMLEGFSVKQKSALQIDKTIEQNVKVLHHAFRFLANLSGQKNDTRIFSRGG